MLEDNQARITNVKSENVNECGIDFTIVNWIVATILREYEGVWPQYYEKLVL